MREVRLVEADANFKVVKDFVVGSASGIGHDVLTASRPASRSSRSSTTGRAPLAGDRTSIVGQPAVAAMVGLQARQTTSTAKSPARSEAGCRPLLVAADLTGRRRPAPDLGKSLDIPVYRAPGTVVADIVRGGVEAAKRRSATS
jgi:signal recognition particle GTPase